MKLGALSTDIRKITRISHVMKIRPVGAELFHVDGQKDMTKLIGLEGPTQT